MSKGVLPAYAIAELLIRLAKYDEAIGDYKDHAVYDNEVIVRTSAGSIIFLQSLIVKQLEAPVLITEAELAAAASFFKSTD